MSLITDIANAIRKDEPKNLFCILELGDHGKVFVYSSGRGFAPQGQNVSCFYKNNRVTFVNEDEKNDGEERMVKRFPQIYRDHGRSTQNITMITAASPCNRVCANAIVHLANDYRHRIRTWTIAYHAPYRGESEKYFANAINTLNNYWSETPQIRAFNLTGSFIDLSTIHRA